MIKRNIINNISFPIFRNYIGDYKQNISQIIHLVKESSKNKQIEFVVFPELALCGYIPNDLLMHNNFINDAETALQNLIHQLKINKLSHIHVFVGNITAYIDSAGDQKLQNSYFEIFNNEVVRKYTKRNLPNYGVFDERRYFNDNNKENDDFTKEGHAKEIAVALCEDIWGNTELEINKNHQVLVVANASPYEVNKKPERNKQIKEVAQKYQIDVAYTNITGAVDELVFDNHQVFYNYQLNKFYIISDSSTHYDEMSVTTLNEIYQQLIDGLSNYVEQNRFKSVCLGLSGGIDSAFVATLASDTLGSDNVYGVLMPNIYSSDHSVLDAKNLAENLQIMTYQFDIANSYQTFQKQFLSTFDEKMTNIADQNIQARIRGQVLMALSNQETKTGGHLVLATGNKSELAVGYSTIYGDAVGGFAPIKDVYKTEVYQLAKWRNSLTEQQCLNMFNNKITMPIPESSINKPPSAELKPGQVDQDNLPEYDVLDLIISQIIQDDKPLNTSDQTSPNDDLIKKVTKMIKNSEWKRQQYPVGTKIHKRAFGKDWRMPITQGYLRY